MDLGRCAMLTLRVDALVETEGNDCRGGGQKARRGQGGGKRGREGGRSRRVVFAREHKCFVPCLRSALRMSPRTHSTHSTRALVRPWLQLTGMSMNKPALARPQTVGVRAADPSSRVVNRGSLPACASQRAFDEVNGGAVLCVSTMLALCGTRWKAGVGARGGCS